MANSIFVEIRPPNVTAFEQAHLFVFPPCCWLSIQRMT
jgi:hypothetical protein